VKATQLLSQIFANSPDAIKHFDQKLELLWIEPTKRQTVNKIQPYFLEVLRQNRKITLQLDSPTLESLGGRYLKACHLSLLPDKVKEYEEQAVWYFIMNAKAGNDSSYKMLCLIIDGYRMTLESWIKSTTKYLPYHTVLIPFRSERRAGSNAFHKNFA
jgi:hypothetical protein